MICLKRPNEPESNKYSPFGGYDPLNRLFKYPHVVSLNGREMTMVSKSKLSEIAA